ncbi:MAG: DUF1501 domain-containing protein [Akkermansiaceae bacterium]|nr:DUF1501 domain-containing protein [Acidimicrobiia bacterium]NNM31038.1 DUF1501 domain-containing protein [Akkermansiaceae bacterium]
MRNPNRKIPLTRRAFMARTACAGMGTTGIVNTLAHLRLMQGALANNISGITGYKAVIVLFEFGGGDANQMLMPDAAHPSRANYEAHRGVLALPNGGTNPTHSITANNLAANPAAPAGAEFFALHPSMPDVQDLFNSGDLCFASNVGTLVTPTTNATYNSVALPPQLYSHSDQQNQWQSSIPDMPFQSGWCGRIADFLNSQNPDSEISMSVSLSGVNDIQVGLTPAAPQYAVTTSGAVSLNGYGSNYVNALNDSSDPTSYKNSHNGRRLMAFQDVMNFTHDHLFEEGYNGVVRRARENEGFVGSAIEEADAWLHPTAVDSNNDPWPFIEGTFLLQNGIDPTTLNQQNNNVLNALPSLSRQLLMIAKLMTGRRCLGNSRQIFFCSYGGHDTHSDQGGFGTDVNGNPNVYVPGDIDALMLVLNDALKAFNDCMHELETRESGMGLPAGEEFTYNDFILASHSDFNRTFTPNGTIAGPSGSDHAWGTHCFAMGGDVKGGNVYGYYPDLDPDPTAPWSAPISSRGLWIPTTAIEQFAAPLAKWMGVTSGEVEAIFPNLERFADPFTAGYDPTDYSTMLDNANMDYINGVT